MIENILELDELEPSVQQALCELLLAREDHDRLAQLCCYPGLDPRVDDRLSAVRAVKVRAAWIGRPGRDPEALATALRSERRVGVLCAVAENPDTSPEIIEAIADRSDSAKVLEAVLEAPAASDAACTTAARKLAKALDANGKAFPPLAAARITGCPPALAACCLAVPSPVVIRLAATADTLDAVAARKLVDTVVKGLLGEAAQVGPNLMADRWGGYQNRLTSMVNLTVDLMTACWADTKMVKDLQAALTVLRDAAQAFLKTTSPPAAFEGPRRDWVRDSWKRMVETWTERLDNPPARRTPSGDLLAPAHGPFAEARAGIGRIGMHQHRATSEAYAKVILHREDLTTAQKLEILKDRWFYYLHQVETNADLPVSTRVAHAALTRRSFDFTVLARWGCTAEVLDELSALVDDSSTGTWALSQIVAAPTASLEAVLTLPASQLARILELRLGSEQLRHGITAEAARLLAPYPPETWEFFENMYRHHSGPLETLIRSCAVATGVAGV